jgi:hypothetical protein
LEGYELFQALLVQPHLVYAVDKHNNDFSTKFEGLKVFPDPGAVGLRDPSISLSGLSFPLSYAASM